MLFREVFSEGSRVSTLACETLVVQKTCLKILVSCSKLVNMFLLAVATSVVLASSSSDASRGYAEFKSGGGGQRYIESIKVRAMTRLRCMVR